MKRILVTAAEPEEIVCAEQAHRLHEHNLDGKIEVDFMLTGIGTTSTCYRLTKKLLEAQVAGRPYNLVINIGIAGSYSFNDTPQAPALFPMGRNGNLIYFRKSPLDSLLIHCNDILSLLAVACSGSSIHKVAGFFYG